MNNMRQFSLVLATDSNASPVFSLNQQLKIINHYA